MNTTRSLSVAAIFRRAALVALAPAALILPAGATAYAVSAPFSWSGVNWCPSYHAHDGCATIQHPAQYTNSFDPAQISMSGSPAYVTLAMNSDATVSGAFNTWGQETWVPPVTFTEQLTVPCDSHGKIYNWPAFWAVGTVGAWPADGEIDIFEGLSGNATWTYHYLDASGHAAQKGATVPGNWCGTHTYSASWTASAITFTWDGQQVGQVTPASIGVPIATDPMYVIDDYGTNPAYGGPVTGSVSMTVYSFSAS